MQTPRDKIRELRALLDEGLLSEQEFTQRKNAILDRELAPHVSSNTSVVMQDLTTGTDLGFLAGQEIGGFSKRYRLERLLGQGGMGQVWLAIDLATQAQLGHSEMVALKILPPQLTQSTLYARLLIEEASMVRKLAHENIVRVYEWAQDPATSSYFIIMEYLNGQDLETYLAAHGPCSFKQTHQLLLPVARALQYAWEKHKLVHRDLKPGNLFLTQQGDIKLLDFGISARLRTNTNTGFNTSSKPSSRLPGAGTFGYRAPEAGAQQQLFSPSLDVYAVAVMMLEMLTGSLPPLHHYAQTPKRPASLNAAQWQILQSGFAIDPNQRPASVLALLKAMAVAQAGTVSLSDAPQIDVQQISQSETTARLRAEQRRQRKELEQQRRQQAKASLHALINRQKKIRESEAAPEPSKVQANGGISWEDAKRYLASISQTQEQQVRLPGEDEWTSACRGANKKSEQ